MSVPPAAEEEEQAKRIEQISLLELAQRCLAQSRMIFLVADLRLLSSTGRITTKYDALCLDSDRFLRTDCEGMACVETGVPGGEKGHHSGITACHVMAILLLEMNNSLSSQRGEDVIDFGEDLGTGLMENLKISRSNPILARKAEGDLHSLLQAYVATIREDLMEEIPKVPLKDLSSKLSDATNSFDTDLRSPSFEPTSGPLLDEKRKNKFKKRAGLNLDFRSLGAHIFASVTAINDSQICDRDDLTKILKRAIVQRDIGLLSFLKTFFKEGSITKMMAKSQTELMWLHDWHSQKECTYAISMDRVEKTITVIFRGATTAADWDHSLHVRTVVVDNPIDEDYTMKEKSLYVHSGYYRYLFRKRKDTKTTKYDEISAKVKDYGAIIGDDYKLVVTGHSLGGALTTIFAFYASREESFTKNGPLQAITFGCPRIAGYQFVDAIRHQEDSGKLQLARFHNVRDAITHLPPGFCQRSRRGATYFHVGLDVRLPLIRNDFFRMFGQPKPRFKFTDPETWFSSYKRQWREFYGFNLPIRPWKLANHHSLLEHQKRMQLADCALDSPLVKFSLDEIYQNRYEFTSNADVSILKHPEKSKKNMR